MKLIFDTIQLGGGPNYYLDKQIQGLDGELENNIINIPRTDYTEGISDFLTPKFRTFSGTLVGNDADDFRDKKKDFLNRLRQSYTFTLVDDYIEPDGSVIQYGEYQFDGKIIAAEANNQNTSNLSEYSLTIYSQDPYLYSTTQISESGVFAEDGFTFPLIFPFVFSSTSNTLTVVNLGVETYVNFEILGVMAGGFTIRNEDSTSTNKTFTYSGNLDGDDVVLINPRPDTAVKVTFNGTSAVSLTNKNYEIFKIPTGTTTFTLIGDGGSATASFNPRFIGI